jgi:ATP-binding cassette subfamily F protein 2
MAGELQPTEGSINRRNGLVLGRYHQHSAEMLDMSLSYAAAAATRLAIAASFCFLELVILTERLLRLVFRAFDFFRQEFPPSKLAPLGQYPEGMTDEEWRSFIGRYGLSGDLQMTQMGKLSDGQKARLIYAVVTLSRPNVLLLDEPTNHLDVGAIDSTRMQQKHSSSSCYCCRCCCCCCCYCCSFCYHPVLSELKQAMFVVRFAGLAGVIKSFTGGVVLVSHDFRLIDQVADVIWECTGPQEGATIKVRASIDNKLDIRHVERF